MKSIKVRDFSLEHTLECSQFFGFKKLDNWYYVIQGNKLFRVKQEGSKLLFEGAPSPYVRKFFSLGENYRKIIREISKDRRIKRAIDYAYGLRLIKQPEPWECLVGYVLSANSSVKKVQNNMSRIAKKFGKPMSFNGYQTHRFPGIGKLGTERQLRKCGAGFRAKYLSQINTIVDSKFFRSINKLNYEQASAKLQQLPGVGQKVSDCVLLFAYSKREAFPVDIWVERAMKPYFGRRELSPKKIAELGRERFGENAGYAQQFLYYHKMNNPDRA